MDYTIIRNDKDFHKWHEYAPLDGQYVKYADSEPSIIAASHKIEDVYYCFCNARQSFLCANYDNYGDISGSDKLSMTNTKSHFLIYAVLEYAICLDLSWQVIWAYIQPSSFEYLIEQKYKEMEKECDRDNIHIQLNCIISQGGVGITQAQRLKRLLTDFENDDTIKKLRSIYNSLKHHGTIHFCELGPQLNTMLTPVNGRKIPILSRKSYSIQEIEELLFSYHFKFKEYFNTLIREIMPADYKDGKVPFVDYYNTLIRMDSITNQNN